MIARNRTGDYSRTRSRFQAFTMIEILVSVFVIAILMGLLLPAVQSVRDTARRAECSNRLRQLGLAIQEFEGTHKLLPQISCSEGSESEPVLTPQARLLPYLDQASAFQEIVSVVRMPVEAQKRKFRFAVFHCPSESNGFGLNYRVCTGRSAYSSEPRGDLTTTKSGVGAFAANCDGIPLSAIADGLSNTVAMSERSIGNGQSGQYDATRDVWYNTAILLGFNPQNATADEIVSSCDFARTNDPGLYYSSTAGHNFLDAGYVDTIYNHLMPSNSKSTDCIFSITGNIDVLNGSVHSVWGAVSARSDHRDQTVNVLFLDGSVRSASAGIDIEIWRSSASRQDGDTSW